MLKSFQRSFWALLLTQFFGALNDNLFRTSITTLIAFKYFSDSHSNILIYFALGLFISPFFIFSIMAGQIADNYPKRELVIKLKFLEVLISGLVILAFYLQNIPFLLFLIFLTGTQSAFFGPLKYSILPEILKKNRLLKGNAFIQSTTFIAILIGGALGSKLLKSKDDYIIIAILLFINSIIGLLSAFYINHLKVKHKPSKISYNIIGTTISLCRDIASKSSLTLSILGISWLWFVGSVLTTSIPIITSELLRLPSDYFARFFLIFTIGISVGSFASNYLLKQRITSKYVPLALLLVSIAIFDFAYLIHKIESQTNFSLTRIFSDFFLISFFLGIYSVPLYSILQRDSSDNTRSKNIAINNIFNAFFILLAAAFLIISQNLLKLDFSSTFFLLGIMNLVIALYAAVLLPEILIKVFLKKLLLFLFRVEVTGIENYYKAGNKALIIANHTSYLDPALLEIFLPHKLNFAIHTQQSQKWWVKLLLKLVSAYPIDSSKPLALKKLVAILLQNKRVVIFPEGRISTTGALMKIYEGPALIADKAKASILPIKITGTEFSAFSKMQGILKLNLLPKIKLDIFPPQKIILDANLSLKEKRYQAGVKLYDIMSELSFKTYPYCNNLFEALFLSARKYGYNKTIIRDVNNNQLTYKKLLISSYILAKKLSQQETNIGVLLPNSCAVTTVFFALQSLSKVAVMINYTAGKLNIISACHTATIKTVVTSRQFVEKAKLFEVIAAIESKNIKIIFLEDIKEKISLFNKLSGYFKFLQNYFFKPSTVNNKLINTPAVILFTSGSEGYPKAVLLTHQNIQANLAQAISQFDFNPNNLVLNALPIFHCYGLTAGTLLPLMSGIPVFLYPTPLHYKIIPEIAYDIGATILFGTNSFLKNYAKHAHPYDFYKMKYVIAGAEKLHEETQNLWNRKFGIRILEGYGVTEATPVISINTPMHYKENTAGRILPGISYKVKKVPGIKEGGELYISGPNIMKGYIKYGNPKKIIAPANGYHCTGDIAKIDNEGFLTILGRTKRFTKISGEMIPLATIEEKINQLWPEYTHAIITTSEKEKHEKIVLITNNNYATKKEIQQFFQKLGLPTLYNPKEIISIEKIPLLGTGKINYPLLLEQLKTRSS